MPGRLPGPVALRPRRTSSTFVRDNYRTDALPGLPGLQQAEPMAIRPCLSAHRPPRVRQRRRHVDPVTLEAAFHPDLAAQFACEFRISRRTAQRSSQLPSHLLTHKAGWAWKREAPAGRAPSAHPAGDPTAQAAEGAGLSVSRCFTMTTTPRSTIRPCAATIAIQKRIGSCAIS